MKTTRLIETQHSLLRSLLGSGRAVALRVEGKSMEPVLGDGDRVTVEPTDYRDCRPGDILVYERDGALITHVLHYRIEAGDKRWLLLKGLSNPRGDRPITWEKVLGRATQVQRGRESAPLDAMKIHATSALAWRGLVRSALQKLRSHQGENQ